MKTIEKAQNANKSQEIYENYLIKKKSGRLENWDDEKIIIATSKSADRAVVEWGENEHKAILNEVYELILDHDGMFETDKSTNKKIIEVATLHSLVELALDKINKEVAVSYRDYRNWVKNNVKVMERLYQKSQSILDRGDSSNNEAVDNANADATLCSTQAAKIKDYFLTEQYEMYFLNKEEKLACDEGYIYIHDKNLRKLTFNCCLFDIATVLKDGFEMGNIWYNEPKTLDVAFDVIGDIVLSAASQQYGGFTVPRADYILESYAQKSYELYVNKYINICHMDKKEAEELAYKDVVRDFDQGFQGWEYKFNTVASSRGDYPFISVSFGLQNTVWGKECCKSILRVRRKGQGKKGFKKPVLFPKLIFLYDKNLHMKAHSMADVFDEAILCSSKTMYPDYLSLTGEGYVADMYKKYGLAVSPMGCRAFLSPWYIKGGITPANDEDTPVFEGRFNIGVVSLNLPMIYAKSEKECKPFKEILDYYLNMIRRIHKKTYDYLANKKASIDPLGFCEGGFYGGHLSLNDKIEPVLRSSTASFGITALNELQELYNQKSIREDGQFALKVMKYIKEKIEEYKKEDNYLYAIYGTPAEKLCGLQVKQFRNKYGIITNVSDKLYVSNSFHCHVSEDITPVEKQDKEKRFWDYFNGGKIQYCRYPIGYNAEAIRTMVERAMELGFYEGVNLSLAYCDDCGHQELEMDVCPVCGSRNLTKIDRMNGYLAYSRVHGDTRLNEAKMAEIHDRKSM